MRTHSLAQRSGAPQLLLAGIVAPSPFEPGRGIKAKKLYAFSHLEINAKTSKRLTLFFEAHAA